MNKELAERLILITDESLIKKLKKGQVVSVTREERRSLIKDYRVIFDNNSEEITLYYSPPLPEETITLMTTKINWVDPTPEGHIIINPWAYERRIRLGPTDEGYTHFRQDLYDLGLIDEKGKRITIIK